MCFMNAMKNILQALANTWVSIVVLSVVHPVSIMPHQIIP